MQIKHRKCSNACNSWSSDERHADPECSDGKKGRRNGRGCFHERIVQTCFQKVPARARTQRSCVGIARRKVIELPKVARNRDHDWVRSRGSKKCEKQQEITQKQLPQEWKDKSHVEGLQIQRNECIRSWRGRLGRDRVHRNGKHPIFNVRKSAVVRKRSQNLYWDRLVCCSDCVPPR